MKMKKLNNIIATLLYCAPIIAMETDEYTKPRDFSKANLLITHYVKEHGLEKEIKNLRKSAVSSILNDLDFINNKEQAEIFDYALWYYPNESKEILDENPATFKFDQLCEKLKKNPPILQITGYAGSTPLGGFRGQSSETVPLYGILKFIGQYTQDRNQFDQSIATIKQIANQIKGPISHTEDVLFLMNMNKNFTGSYAFPRPSANALFHKKRDFTKSIYHPAPNQEDEHYAVKHGFACFLEKFNSQSAQTLIMQCLLNAHYSNPKNIHDLISSFRQRKTFGHEHYSQTTELKNVALEVMNRNDSIIDDSDNHSKQINVAATEIIKELELQDSNELMDIISKALIYIKDDKIYNKNDNTFSDINLNFEDATKKLAFEKLFTTGIVPIDSDMAHYAIRESAKEGRAWALSFLIQHGVSVNPPVYKQFRIWRFKENTMSPLDLALEKNNQQAIMLLKSALKHGNQEQSS
jgi:hypothetical protein